MQCCCSSADTATRVLAATDLHLLTGTLLPGPKQQVSGHVIFLFSPGLLLQKSLLSKYGVAEQQSIAWWVAGGLHLTATHRKEKKYRKNQTFAGRGEAPALPEVLGGPCLGLAACRARIRPWLPQRAALQDRVEVSSGCGAT